MIIALDAMGGDNAPASNIDGAIEAVKGNPDLNVILVGRQDVIRWELESRGYKGSNIVIEHSDVVVEMDDSPSVAVRRKKDSSLGTAIKLVRDKRADAAVSAGNSGAMMGLALMILGRAELVDRPAIGAVMPSLKTPFLMLDAGANVDCDPENMLQFALMGDAYSKNVLKVETPRVALLSIGEEPTKGNELTKEAFKLLGNAGVNFIGNIESKEVYLGGVDVLVCDGFVGNVFLKTSEGLADVMIKMFKREIKASFMAKVGYIFVSKVFKNVMKTTNYDEYGGAPLLGINGACIIAHGRSTPKAIKNAIWRAAEFASNNVCEAITENIRNAKKGAQIAG